MLHYKALISITKTDDWLTLSQVLLESLKKDDTKRMLAIISQSEMITETRERVMLAFKERYF